jgi:hypothetical protein
MRAWGALVLALLALGGCAGGRYAIVRIDGAGEGCAPQLVGFTEAGDGALGPAAAHAGFAAPALPWQGTPMPGQRGAAVRPPGTAPLADRLAAENAAIERLQIAFDALLYCRWIEARTVRADLAAGRVPRPDSERRMAALRARLNRDLARARELLQTLEARAAERTPQVEAAAPGVSQEASEARAARGRQVAAVAAATVPLRLRPEAAAPEIGTLPQGRSVRIRPQPNGFAHVEGAGTPAGYAPIAAFQIAGRAAPPPATPAESGPAPQLRQLAATNISRRENFAESLGIAEAAAVSGFELGA